jgi:hypothetical protein
MHAAFGMTNERSFEVNPEWKGAPWLPAMPTDRPAQMVKGFQDAVSWSGNGRRQITGNAVFRHVAFDGGKRGVAGFHHVVPRAPVDVNVNEARRQRPSRKIKVARVTRRLFCLARADVNNAPIVNQNNGAID